MAKHGSQPGPDCYCRKCKSTLVMQRQDPARAREAKARYIEKLGGREAYNAIERRRKNRPGVLDADRVSKIR